MDKLIDDLHYYYFHEWMKTEANEIFFDNR